MLRQFSSDPSVLSSLAVSNFLHFSWKSQSRQQSDQSHKNWRCIASRVPFLSYRTCFLGASVDIYTISIFIDNCTVVYNQNENFNNGILIIKICILISYDCICNFFTLAALNELSSLDAQMRKKGLTSGLLWVSTCASFSEVATECIWSFAS